MMAFDNDISCSITHLMSGQVAFSLNQYLLQIMDLALGARGGGLGFGTTLES